MEIEKVKELQAGGQGAIALCLVRGKYHALKTIQPKHHKVAQAEAKAGNRLSNQHIHVASPVERPFEDNGVFHFVYPLASGDMHDTLCQMPHSAAGERSFAREWMLQLSHALSFCHKSSVRVAHRDIKPENVLLFPCAHERYQKEGMLLEPSVDPSRAKTELMRSAAGLGDSSTREHSAESLRNYIVRLCDFGSALTVGSQEPLTGRSPHGSKPYAPPEMRYLSLQRSKSSASQKLLRDMWPSGSTLPAVADGGYDATKVDVWSFGITVYRVVTGRLPFAVACPSDADFRGFLLKTQPEVMLDAECAPHSAVWSDADDNSPSFSPGGAQGQEPSDPQLDQYARLQRRIAGSKAATHTYKHWRWPSRMSLALVDLLKRCLRVHPSQRTSMRRIRDHKWFSKPHWVPEWASSVSPAVGVPGMASLAAVLTTPHESAATSPSSRSSGDIQERRLVSPGPLAEGTPISRDTGLMSPAAGARARHPPLNSMTPPSRSRAGTQRINRRRGNSDAGQSPLTQGMSSPLALNGRRSHSRESSEGCARGLALSNTPLADQQHSDGGGSITLGSPRSTSAADSIVVRPPGGGGDPAGGGSAAAAEGGGIAYPGRHRRVRAMSDASEKSFHSHASPTLPQIRSGGHATQHGSPTPAAISDSAHGAAKGTRDTHRPGRADGKYASGQAIRQARGGVRSSGSAGGTLPPMHISLSALGQLQPLSVSTAAMPGLQRAPAQRFPRDSMVPASRTPIAPISITTSGAGSTRRSVDAHAASGTTSSTLASRSADLTSGDWESHLMSRSASVGITPHGRAAADMSPTGGESPDGLTQEYPQDSLKSTPSGGGGDRDFHRRRHFGGRAAAEAGGRLAVRNTPGKFAVNVTRKVNM